MAVQLKWPWLGVAIPTFLISLLGYGSHYFVFQHHLSYRRQIFFQCCLTMIWVSYVVAIYKDPGSPPTGFQPVKGEWRRYCKKCKNYKPERTHHCKTCKKCVLKMDHHCPWTMSCVGHGNLPHFLRFLLWVVFTTGFVLVELSKRAIVYYQDRNLPSYLVSKTEMFMVVLLFPIDFFVLLTISILLLRSLNNVLFSGMTQIETWERERIESQLNNGRIWKQIKKNYFKLHGKEMPKLTSWNGYSMDLENERANEDETTKRNYTTQSFTIDDIIFPYDLGMASNLVDAVGYPWDWMLPWGQPRGDGARFKKNEYMEDDQLGLPWPPDGGHQEIEEDVQDEEDRYIITASGRRRRRYVDPRLKMKRTEWFNDLGEKLDDFGVDVDAEDEENDDLLAD